MAEQWLSILEYARAFAMSDMTVRRRIKNGKIRAVLRDGKYYIPLNAERPEAPVSQPRVMAQPIERPVVRPNYDYAPPKAPEPLSTPTVSRSVIGQVPASTYNPIPETVTRPLLQYEQSAVNTQQLLGFCQNILKRAEGQERHIEQKYRAELDALQQQIQNRNLEIAQLKQQVEDLSLLVKMFERK